MDPILPVAAKTNGKSKLSSTFIIFPLLFMFMKLVTSGQLSMRIGVCKRVEYPDTEKIVMTH